MSARDAMCVGCGCTDSQACLVTLKGRPCSWLRVDRATGLGVCSNCPDALDAWDAGERVPLALRAIDPRIQQLLDRWASAIPPGLYPLVLISFSPEAGDATGFVQSVLPPHKTLSYLRGAIAILERDPASKKGGNRGSTR